MATPDSPNWGLYKIFAHFLQFQILKEAKKLACRFLIHWSKLVFLDCSCAVYRAGEWWVTQSSGWFIVTFEDTGFCFRYLLMSKESSFSFCNIVEQLWATLSANKKCWGKRRHGLQHPGTLVGLHQGVGDHKKHTLVFVFLFKFP